MRTEKLNYDLEEHVEDLSEVIEEINYEEYLKSVRAEEFKADPLNSDPLVTLFHTGHLEVNHS